MCLAVGINVNKCIAEQAKPTQNQPLTGTFDALQLIHVCPLSFNFIVRCSSLFFCIIMQGVGFRPNFEDTHNT